MALTAAYVSDHLAHTKLVDEAWGQEIARVVLEEAMRQLSNRSVDTETVQLNFKVSENQPHQCVRICLSNNNGGEICTHVGIKL